VQQQISFDELGMPLHEVTFAILDIETTGGSPDLNEITEIGIVKVKGGEIVGEFQTLVNPGVAIPINIEILTGISTNMTAAAPRIAQVLPSFFEFMAGAIPVAHNARFDIGFLRSAAIRHGYSWDLPKALDTVNLAKVALGRDEVRNRKLATLAQRFGTTVQPNHRALSDARATVEVFHALLERLGRLGVHDLDELQAVSPKISEQVRTKSKLADQLPNLPGCYLLKDAQGTVLYVGVSQNLKKRVKSYFTKSEQRNYVRNAVAITTTVSTVVCTTATEARVRELRLIAQHRPPANKVARNPEKIWWIYFNSDAVPRLIVSKNPPDLDQSALGPFNKKAIAIELQDFMNNHFRLRTCIDKLKNRPNHPGCIRGEMNHCLLPCQAAEIDEYLDLVKQVEQIMHGNTADIDQAIKDKLQQLSASERFEDAEKLKRAWIGLERAAYRISRLRKLVKIELFLSQNITQAGIEIHVIKHGRLVATSTAANEIQLPQVVKAVLMTAELVEPRGILPAKALANFDDAPAAIGEAELLMSLPDVAAALADSAEFLPMS